MTDNEREEFVYDLATDHLEKTSKAGIYALAHDHVCQMLLASSDEELIKMARTKKKKKNKKPTGFNNEQKSKRN